MQNKILAMIDFDHGDSSYRFGETRCLVATRNILKGEEILVNYAYNLKKFVPDWYKKLHAKTFTKFEQN